MTRRTIVAAVVLMSLARAASAHRLDEYLQATLISVQRDHVDVSMRLIPGVAVSSSVIAGIDSNGDGVFSKAEQWTYAEQVVGNLSLSDDGNALTPKLTSVEFPTIAQMRDGIGEIHIEYTAGLPDIAGARRFLLESRSREPKTVYLVNALAASDPLIRIVAQKRNAAQSTYELDYVQTGAASDAPAQKEWGRMTDALSVLGLPGLFRLGVRHIAEGTDHLLFLLVLLLPAPLVVMGSRWAGIAGVRSSLLRIVRIVTAFTLGHSIALAPAAFGVVHVPGHPIEVLIAISILISAVHALRPIFPGKEAGIAAFFGLIHGLAFASTLSDLGLGRWERLAGILSFNLGIETMQMAVVVATLPSLLLMSRTRAYPWLRTGGALFAIVASIGWIVERVLGLRSSVDFVVNNIAHHAGVLAGGLFLTSLVIWIWQRSRSAMSSSTESFGKEIDTCTT
jgi:hypothetical protein